MSGSTFHREWLSDKEFEIGRRLEKASLVVEINIDENELRDLQTMYGGQAAEMLRVAVPPDKIIMRYPALTLAILSGQACLGYEQHRYWNEFFLQLNLQRDQLFEQSLRRALRPLLKRFGLRDFPELKNDYVQLMALHSAFPVYCMGDIVVLLEQRLVSGTEMTGAAVIEWLHEPGKKHRMNNLDVPVRNFIQFGGQLAVDVINRIIEFIAFTAQTEDWSASEIDLETATTGLPTLLLDRLIELLKERPFASGPKGAIPRQRRMRKPSIAYVPLDRQVVVEVPYPELTPMEPWRLSFDGETVEVLAEPGWGVPAGDEHPPTVVPVPSPVREILMQHLASGERIQLPVVDKRDPLLIFDVDGRWIPKHTTLPRGSVLALMPVDSVVVEASTGDRLEPSGPVLPPAGWRGWVVAEFDLSGSRGILLDRDGVRTAGASREIREPTAPEFEHGTPSAGLQTLNGLTVYGSRPDIILPANPGQHPVEWRIRIRRSDSAVWLVDIEVQGEDEEQVMDPFVGIDDAVLGLYEIQVAGPVGSDIRQQAFYAEGIEVEYSRPFRCPAKGGLEPVTASTSSEWDLRVEKPLIDFSVTDRDKVVTITKGSLIHRLRLTPPYLQIRADVVGTPALWLSHAAVLAPADLEADRDISLHAPGAEAAVFQLKAENGRLLKDVTPNTPHYEYFQASSRIFYDAARSAGSCRIVALVDDEQGRTVEIVLVHVRPTALCTGAQVSGACLILENPADEEDLAVNIWAKTAPWRQVQTVAVANGQAEIPPDYLNAGPLLTQVFVDDPWVSITPPSWPDTFAIEVFQTGWMRDEDRGRDNLARFLAAAGPAPSGAINMPEVWSALALLPLESEDVHTQQLRSALSRILGENSRAALEALGNSTIPLPEMMSLLIRTGLVFRSFESESTLNDLHPNPWVGCMVEMADLPSLYERRDYVGGERTQTLDYLEDKGGMTLIEVLSHGKSRELYEGVFDRQTMMFDALPASRVEEIIEKARFVPGALLDIDTRVGAVIDAFHARDDWTREGWSPSFGSATVRALDVIRRTRGQIHREVTARNEKLDGVDTTANRWMLMPLQSLAMAVLARMDAHGLLHHSPLTTDFQESWARLARMCPGLVMTDLLIAEALATHASHGDLIGEYR